MDFFELVLSGWNLLLVLAIAAAMVALESAIPEAFKKGGFGNRVEVFLPMLLAVVFSTSLPGPWMPEGVLIGQKLVLGVLMGFAAYNSAGFLKRYGGRIVADRLKVVFGIQKKKDP